MNYALKDFTGYTTIRRDRSTRSSGGGLVALVHHSVSYKVPVFDIFPDDNTAEVLSVEANLEGSTLTFFNVYIPRRPPAPDFDALPVPDFDSGNQMALGNINAHHPS